MSLIPAGLAQLIPSKKRNHSKGTVMKELSLASFQFLPQRLPLSHIVSYPNPIPYVIDSIPISSQVPPVPECMLHQATSTSCARCCSTVPPGIRNSREPIGNHIRCPVG